MGYTLRQCVAAALGQCNPWGTTPQDCHAYVLPVISYSRQNISIFCILFPVDRREIGLTFFTAVKNSPLADNSGTSSVFILLIESEDSSNLAT